MSMFVDPRPQFKMAIQKINEEIKAAKKDGDKEKVKQLKEEKKQMKENHKLLLKVAKF